jgi:hypothetical protein
MLLLAAVNALSAAAFACLYVAAAVGSLAPGAYVVGVIALLPAAVAVWVRTERLRGRGREPLARLGRAAAGLVLSMVAVPGLVLMPVFSLQQQLPPEALGERFVPAMMVLLLFSMSFVAVTNVVGALYIVGAAVLARLRGSA